MTVQSIGDPKYISLRTFRLSGVAVDTPVWAAADSGRLYVMTAPPTGKVKRIRNDPRVEVRACDMRGRPQGPSVTAQSRIVADPAETAAGLERLKRKYGLQFRLANWRDRSRAETVILEISDRD